MTAPVRAPQRGATAVLIVLELLIGGSAVVGGLGLMRDGMGLPAAWLAATPFPTWTWPGIFLLAGVAAPMLVAAAMEAAGMRRAGDVSVAAGAALVVWIVVQLAVLQQFSVLQPVMAAAGLAVVLAARWAHRVWWT
ncbi:hypothetical protein [Pseudonocardia sp. GCM10023141]|uniref:hypothetical protein n=1 Tax=Pseudonocardia sp. GCM10023141 TaxID=3252653 RepID=UPI0036174CB2